MDRQETIKEINRKIEEEIKSLQDIIAEQKKHSSEAEEAMLDMVKEIVGKIKGEIEVEKKNSHFPN